MADYCAGDSVVAEFITSNFTTGAAQTADSLPTGTLNRNGTDDGAVTVTVANITTGRYSASFTVPTSYAIGDVLNLSIAATVNSVTGAGIIWSTRLGVYGFRQASKAIATLVVAGGSSTTSINISSITPSAAQTNQFVGEVLAFTLDTLTANLRGQKTNILASAIGGPLTVTALTDAPASGDVAVIE